MTAPATPRHRASRDALVAAILAVVATDDLLSIDEIRVALEREIDELRKEIRAIKSPARPVSKAKSA